MGTQRLQGSLIGAIGLLAAVAATAFVVLPGREVDSVATGDEEVSAAQIIATISARSRRPPAPEAVAAYEKAQNHIKAGNFSELIVAFELLSEAVRTSPVYRAAGRQLWEVAWALEYEMGYQPPNPELYW